MNMFPQQTMMNPQFRINNGIIWVQGIEGAKAYQLAPNSNAILLDSENDGKFYIKVSDNVGMCNLRTFSYTEVTNTPTTDMSNYVTRQELETMLRGIRNEQPIPGNAKSSNTKQSN